LLGVKAVCDGHICRYDTKVGGVSYGDGLITKTKRVERNSVSANI